MKRVTAYIRPHRLEAVKSAITVLGISGLTVSDVRGTGNSPEVTDFFGGDDALIALPIRAKIEVVVLDDQVKEIVNAVIDAAQTGETGDGKIFIEPVEDAIRARTRERSDAAV